METSNTDVRNNNSKKRNARPLEPKKEPWAKSHVGGEHISHTIRSGELVSFICSCNRDGGSLLSGSRLKAYKRK